MDITKVGPRILKQNRELAMRQALTMASPESREWAQGKVDAIDAELARRAGRVSSVGGTQGYVLTSTGQFEHLAGERDGFTKCGVAIDTSRQYGDREWFHCLLCSR